MMEMLKHLPTPTGRPKEALLQVLLSEEYGYLPGAPDAISAESLEEKRRFAAGKATCYRMRLDCRMGARTFSFPFVLTLPKANGRRLPCFLLINFRDAVPDEYLPAEELVDYGYAVLSFCYTDVSSDDGDFTSGLAGVVYPDGKRSSDACGKIGLWAWAALRLLDYALTREEIDPARISVVGHSRLGKTALLAGALDERFYCAFSNDSGCSGAALAREKGGERIADICRRFPFWFCENYPKYAGNEAALPFDQHFLLAANFPHRVYVASAMQDAWADPKSEYLSCMAASEYYEAGGMRGFVAPETPPTSPAVFHAGTIGYHLRRGEHYLSREDWGEYIRYLEEQEQK